MKKRFWILFLACACLLMAGCENNKKKNTPEAVTEAFAKAFYTADFTHMYQYSTKKSHIVIQHLQNGMKGHPEIQEEMSKKEIAIVEITVDDQSDSTAICTGNVTIDGKPRTDVWELQKEDGEWKVTMVAL